MVDRPRVATSALVEVGSRLSQSPESYHRAIGRPDDDGPADRRSPGTRAVLVGASAARR